MLSEYERATLNTFVTPFYLELSNVLVADKYSEAEQEAWLTKFTEVAYELDEPTARQLLASGNWRSHLTISWMVGFRDWTHFAEQLEQTYETSTRKAQPGLSVGLVMLGRPSSASVLCRYLDAAFDSEYWGERPGWALAALVELDKQHDTDWANHYLADGGPWQQYADRPTRQLAPIANIVSTLTSYRKP